MRRGRGRPGLLGTMARTTVIAGTASAVSGRAAQRREERAAAQAPPPAAAGESGELELVTQLKQLAALQEQGILTPEEFAAKKALLLGI
jgi:hypothetical protein